ncbi:MFS transporter [Phenylobacterium sp. LjRoot219]|uniref:spinster family MFS transporter n=1 Tax=Phenylobacterium sp. LjRoot219 TaxID=3342283 RepID=UPI003ECE2A6B
MTASDEAAVAAPAKSRTLGPRTALAILFAISACSMADRFILSILAPDIKRDMQLTDLQLGLLVGPAIAILYAVMSVPLGHLADRVNRVRFLSGCLAIWSVFTAMGGLAINGWQLALSRLGVSAAEGGCVPASISLIADYFPPKRRALASAVHASASSVGMLLAFGVGGLVAQYYGWRTALVVAGLPGVALALLTLLVLREPERGALDVTGVPKLAPDSYFRNLRYLFSLPIYRRALIGAGLIHIVTSVVTSWGPTFLLRKFGEDSSIVGVRFGLGLAVLGASCILLSGWMVNQIGVARFSRSLRIVALIELGAAAFVLLALFSPDFGVAVAAMSLTYGLASVYLPTQLAIVQNYVPASMRATGSATASLIVMLLVHGLAPPLVGGLSDALQPRLGDGGLGVAMLIIVPATLLSAIQYLRTAKAADDLAR